MQIILQAVQSPVPLFFYAFLIFSVLLRYGSICPAMTALAFASCLGEMLLALKQFRRNR